jgi:hypothetical protein
MCYSHVHTVIQEENGVGTDGIRPLCSIFSLLDTGSAQSTLCGSECSSVFGQGVSAPRSYVTRTDSFVKESKLKERKVNSADISLLYVLLSRLK